jgi:hypothetical protein
VAAPCELRVAVPRKAVPFLNVTVPVGVGPAGGHGGGKGDRLAVSGRIRSWKSAGSHRVSANRLFEYLRGAGSNEESPA